MRIEVQSVSKYRRGGQPGDDVVVVLPGVMFGVFDGATDPLGTVIDGIGAGRLAALTVAAAMASLALSGRAAPMAGIEIVAHLTDALAQRCAPLGLEIPPSTTAAVALDCGKNWRFLSVGDSGFRLNGKELYINTKIIDAVSTAARVAVFKDLAKRMDLEHTERAARRAVLLGFDVAVADGMVTAQSADRIIGETIQTTGLPDHAKAVRLFLKGGIKTQFHYANRADHVLGFDSLNGTLPTRNERIDAIRSKPEISSIEIFSDGYPQIPEEISARAWEEAFYQAELNDPHKTGDFASVKGSTGEEFFDDRTVIALTDL